MQSLMRRVRGALGMGVIWGVAGAAIGGVLELIDNILPGALPFISRVDMWPQTLAIPGFMGGVIFALVLMIAGGRRRFDELSIPRFAAWGALAGLVLGSIGVSNGLPLYVLGITALGGAVAASGALSLARRAGDRERLMAQSDANGLPPEPNDERRRLPGED
ncbi:MAG: hypothetical protein U0164_20545 [Gemmatimonadaceae bacterium]